MQFPTKFVKAQTCMITSKTDTEVTTYGMNTVVAKRGNPHKWVVDFATPPMQHEAARELGAFLDSLDGRYETFTLTCPLPFLGGTATFQTGSLGGQGDNSISVTGLPADEIDALKAGDFIKFNGHDKVYKIVQNADSNGSGLATMYFHPRLQAIVAPSTAITEAVFSLRMRKDDLSLSLSAKTGLTPVKISAIEA